MDIRALILQRDSLFMISTVSTLCFVVGVLDRPLCSERGRRVRFHKRIPEDYYVRCSRHSQEVAAWLWWKCAVDGMVMNLQFAFVSSRASKPGFNGPSMQTHISHNQYFRCQSHIKGGHGFLFWDSIMGPTEVLI